ncbi:MAG: DoxX family membrane protein [Chitinophagaceae bacterium]
MKGFPFINSKQSLTLLRMVIAIIFVLDGVAQLRYNTGGGYIGFGNNIDTVLGSFFRWVFALFEITGGVLLALGYFIPLITLLFIIEIILWMLIFAMSNTYTLGYYGSNTWYSLLLIVCLVVIAASKRK